MRSVVLLLFDLAVVVGTAIAALALRDNLELSAAWILDLTPYLVFSLTAAVVVLPVAGANRTFWHYSTFDDFLRVAIAAMVIVLFATGATFAYNRLDGLARAVPILHAVLLVLSLCVLRAAMRLHHGLRTRRRAAPVFGPARQAESVLVIGVNAVAELFVRSVREFARDAVHVAGVLGTDGRHRGHLLHGVQILGAPEDLTRVLRQLEVHGVELRRIVVAMPPSELSARPGRLCRRWRTAPASPSTTSPSGWALPNGRVRGRRWAPRRGRGIRTVVACLPSRSSCGAPISPGRFGAASASSISWPRSCC